MKWFYNLKIGIKLILGFVVVALIAGGIGVMGVINIKTVDRQDTYLYEKMTVPLGELIYITDAYKSITNDVNAIILSGNADSTIKIWNASDGSMVRVLKGHSAPVTVMVLTKDNRFVITGSTDHNLKLFELSTGKLVRTFVGHNNSITTIAISPNGYQFVSGSVDGTVILWDFHQKILSRKFKSSFNKMLRLGFSADGNRIFSSSKNMGNPWLPS